MASFTIRRSVAAPPEVVFDILTNHRAYVEFTPLRRVELEREGTPAPNGVGAIRSLHGIGPPIREEVVEYEAPERFSYKLLSGLPVRDHVGLVSLDPSDRGTLMTYTVNTTPTIPVLGGALVSILRLAISRTAAGAGKLAERRAAAQL